MTGWREMTLAVLLAALATGGLIGCREACTDDCTKVETENKKEREEAPMTPEQLLEAAAELKKTIKAAEGSAETANRIESMLGEMRRVADRVAADRRVAEQCLKEIRWAEQRIMERVDDAAVNATQFSAVAAGLIDAMEIKAPRRKPPGRGGL